MDKKLPVYLLLDTSGSMVGEPIEAVKNGLSLLLSALRADPHALETVHLSVITFDSNAQQVVPMTDLAMFQEPTFTAKGTTALGAALTLLANCIDREVRKSTPEEKGDWKPLVFIMTDGQPTDDWQKGLNDFRRVKTGIVVACAAGSASGAESLLKQITKDVVMLDTADKSTIASFFKWISSSTTTVSKKVDTSGVEATSMSQMPTPPAGINLVL